MIPGWYEAAGSCEIRFNALEAVTGDIPQDPAGRAVEESLTRAAHLEVARARAGWAVAATSAVQRALLAENGWLEDAPEDEGGTVCVAGEFARCGCRDCGCGCQGCTASAPEKQLAPGPASGAEAGPPPDEIALIRAVIYGPLDLDEAELDRLASYDSTPAGICGQCRTGAVLAGSELCWYCDKAGQLAKAAAGPVQRCGDIIRAAWVPGACGCASRETHSQARQAAGLAACDHGDRLSGRAWAELGRDGECRRCGERSIVTVTASRSTRAGTGFAVAALVLFVLAGLVYVPFVLPALVALALAAGHTLARRGR